MPLFSTIQNRCARPDEAGCQAEVVLKCSVAPCWFKNLNVQGKKGGQKAQPGKRGRGGTTLKDLVDAGILAAGRNKITVVYKGITYAASLQSDGLIAYQGRSASY